MTDEKEKVDVIFLMTPKTEDDGDEEVLAFFPKVMWNQTDNACYCHCGQHGPCAEDFARECRPATKEEYKPLLDELGRVGYEPTVLDAEEWLEGGEAA